MVLHSKDLVLSNQTMSLIPCNLHSTGRRATNNVSLLIVVIIVKNKLERGRE